VRLAGRKTDHRNCRLSVVIELQCGIATREFRVISSVVLKNFGPIKGLKWTGLGHINVVLGGNGAGKTFLLKALYAVHKTLEEYKRGNDNRESREILAERLYWTFQEHKIGDLVNRDSREPLSMRTDFVNDGHFGFKFGRDTTKHIPDIDLATTSRPLLQNAIFLPAKEVLSLLGIILKSRDQDRAFGFDDTYVDLARVLSQPPTRGRNLDAFAQARKNLATQLNGQIEFDDAQKVWRFKNARKQIFEIGATAEGVKKLAILDVLLGNKYLNAQSVVFIDEPENALHPSAISHLLDTIELLAASGMQFFMSTHSYFVVKKLLLIARKNNRSIPLLSCEADQSWQSYDLKNGMPDNPVIDESIRLYEEQLEL
jgi:energy-coupling factor transporter ATP-binding protein EcfA2